MSAVLPVQPRTVAAAIIPGLLDREKAIEFLTKECVEPSFDAAQAAEVWEQCRRRMNELPERDVSAPQHLPLTQDEQTEANAFLRRARQSGAANILDVIKFDPSRCIAWQHQIITERSD